MSKKLCTFLLALTFGVVTFFPVGVFANSPDMYKTTEAAYGTPVIDGKIDEVWNKTNYNIIENCRTTGATEYKGWFKVLWDNDRIYVLSRIYDRKPENVAGYAWYNDSVDVYIDENYNRTNFYEEDDYQLRVGWDSFVSGNNYGNFNDVIGKSEVTDNGFISEMSFPLKTTKPKEGLKIGFDVQATAAEELGIEMRCYIWNVDIDGTWSYNNPSAYGTLILKNSVSVVPFEEPEWIPASVNKGYCEVENPVKYDLMENQTVNVDNTQTIHTLLLADDYPLMEISELAEVIGGSSEGNTLKKEDVALTYYPGQRLAEYNGGHLMLEREPSMHGGKLYVPVSSIVPTMLYMMHYNRFGSCLSIWSGTCYPESEITFYAKDYGAVGDGVTYDGKAILSAVNAALNSGRPTTVELEPNKTYLLDERIDNMAYLLIENTENFTFDGKGSKLLLEKPTNSFAQLVNCTNVKIKDVSFDYIEHTASQGRVISMDYDNNSLHVIIDEGLPLPAADDWVKYQYPDFNRGGWWIGQFIDPVENHPKFADHDCFWISEINPIDVDKREYEVKFRDTGFIQDGEVGDRIVFNTRTSAYDIGEKTYGDFTALHAINVRYSGDVTFDGVKIYGSPWFGAECGLNWGRITFRNYGMLTRDGRLLAANSDGIHHYRCRGGLVVENSILMNNLDDHINTKGESTDILEQVDECTYRVNKDMMYRQGDELIFFDSSTHKNLGNAFIKNVEVSSAGGWNITIDRKIDNVITLKDNKGRSTLLYNIDCSGRGSVIRNNKFIYSRRHAYITRSTNSIFMNNLVDNCGGSSLIAKNEIFPSNSEGPFPSSFTMRDNKLQADGIISGYYPVEVKSWNAKMGDSAMIDGFLMENNEINVVPKVATVRISHAKDVYLLNNTLICDKEIDSGTIPVIFLNSEIAKVDGLKLRYKTNIENAIAVIGCKYDINDFTNIDLGDNSAEMYLIK